MRDNGAGKRSDRKNQRQALAAIAIAVASIGLAASLGCQPSTRSNGRPSTASDPEAIIHEIQDNLARGELDAAESKVAAARHDLPSNCDDCSVRVSLIEAEVLTLQGKSKEVARLFCDEHALRTTSPDTTIQQEMFCGLAHAHLGRPLLSSREIDDAEKLIQQSGSRLEGTVLQTKGRILALQNQLGHSQIAFLASLTIARHQQNKQLEAGDLLDLGYLALQEERYGEALDWFSASSQIASAIQSRALLETDLGNVGWTYYKLGDYEVALDKFLAAEKQAEKLGAEVWLENAGLCRQQLGDIPGAAKDYFTALDQAQRAGNKDDLADIHVLIAFLDLRSDHLDDAEFHTDEAERYASVAGYKSAERDARLLQGMIKERQGKDGAAIAMLMNAYRESASSPSIRWQIESTRAAIAARTHRPQEAERWYRKSIATFEDQRNSVKREELKLPFFANGDELYRDYAEFLITSHRPDEALHLLDFGRAKGMADGLDAITRRAPLSSQSPFDPRAIARSQDATILFYSLGPEKSWLWAIDAHHTQLYALPTKLEIESRISAYQKAIQRSADPLRENNGEARVLYETIVAPAAQMIPAGAKVILIPDGRLNELNFESLLVPAGTGTHYWIEDVTITNANSIRLLSRTRVKRAATAARKVLLIGDPVAGSAEFARLPHASAEMETIRRRFAEADSVVLTRDAAIPSAYGASHPDQFSYIHFVAHGMASRLSPLDSAVILSPSPRHPDSYKLYARDIVHQAIHADLVTISSCNGSGVRSYAGEGLVGLSWAFLRAGSHHVIGALWNVDDAATPQLMDELYRGLMRGDGPDTALRNAKLVLLHSEGVHRKPLYWAAFQLYAGS